MHPTYYSKLRHMVADKVRARSQGQVERNTGQPTAKRIADGGLKFGEMEGDCLKAHGAAENLIDRHCYSSDAGITFNCTRCGATIFENEKVKETYCINCNKWGTGTIQTLSKGTLCWYEELFTTGFNVINETTKASRNNQNWLFTSVA
jgi:DNA-directed RNA polymerase beta subunit